MREKALKFATTAHEGQYRKGSTIPYITHPVAVSEIVESWNAPEEAVVAAILHDTYEDTGVTLEELASEFGDEIALIVDRVSEDKTAGSWYNRKLSYIKKLTAKDTPYISLIVAAGDKVHNLTDTYVRWKEEGDECFEMFNAKKSSQSWWYRSMSEIFRENGLTFQANLIDGILDEMRL